MTTILADSPLVYFRFNELGGTRARDWSGHGYDGDYFVDGGTITYGAPGALASDPDPAMGFLGQGVAGDSSRARAAMPVAVNPWGGDFTIEGWLRPNAPPAGYAHGFVVWEDYLVSGFRTGWRTTLRPEFWTTQGGGTSTVTSSVPMVGGAWNYLVFTKAGDVVTIYVNGQSTASSPVSYLPPPPTVPDCIGSDHGMPSDGVFDEIAIYGRALTSEEIAAHRAAGLAP